MISKKLNAEVHQVMQSALARTRSYFESEFGISETVVETGAGDVNSLTLLDMTAIIGMGGQINLLIAFSFQSSLIDALYQRMTSDLALNALLMAVWRRKPKSEVMVHSDQGSQFSSYDWQDFLRANNLMGSMSRRGNCHDNAVAESFFQLLKRERIKRKIYTTREEARQDVFDYIEMFYNPKRRHSHANDLSPVEYEKQ